MSRWIALALALLAAGVLTVTAAAQRGRAFSVPIKDRSGDHERGLDIVRAELGRNARGRLVAEVRMARAWDADALRDERLGQGSVCLKLYVRREADAEPPDYLVCATAAQNGDELVGRVLRERPNALPRTVATARVTRPSRRVLGLRFSQKSIRRPERLRFAAETVRYRRGCDTALGCRDAAPDAPASIGIRLR